jgi:hypothetical protein
MLSLEQILSSDLILSRFENRFIPEPMSGCWLWLGVEFKGRSNRYGRYNRKPAHRISYSLYKGKIPSGLFVLHKCDNGLCVNPDHLFLGTHDDNMADKKAKGRGLAKNSHIVSGDSHYNSKLSADDVAYILSSTESTRVLATKFGVTFQNVWYIRKGQAWKDFQEKHYGS